MSSLYLQSLGCVYYYGKADLSELLREFIIEIYREIN